MANKDETPSTNELSSSLEDYLETIFQVTRERPVARIRDIANIRGVRSASVSPAMRRLEDMGLIKYGRREYIELTAAGEEEARKVYSRHKALKSFFTDILHMSDDLAEQEACNMEHHLSDEGRDRLVRLLEYLNTCPFSPAEVLGKFDTCDRLHGDGSKCGVQCEISQVVKGKGVPYEQVSLADLRAGEAGKVTHINASPAIRQRILDMGVLTGVRVTMERKAPSGDPVWVRLDNYQLSLRKKEAAGIFLEREH